jgi:hypothetical protein
MIVETNGWDMLCNLCIILMEYLSHLTGLSYGFVNIMLFVVLGPLSTLSFMGSTLAHLIIENRKKRETITCILFTCGVIAMLMVVVPIIYAFLTCP